MRIIIIIFLIANFIGCNSVDSKIKIEKVLLINDIDHYDHKISFFHNLQIDESYTIYAKIEMDSLYYDYLKNDVYENCKSYYTHSKSSFTSEQFKLGYYNNEKIPEWFVLEPYSDIDLLISLDTENLSIVKCDQYSSCRVMLKYFDGYCYFILDRFDS